MSTLVFQFAESDINDEKISPVGKTKKGGVDKMEIIQSIIVVILIIVYIVVSLRFILKEIE